MQDRVSLYPGRVKLEPVAGQANTYDLTRADQPTQEGTPLNKATLLSDATAASIKALLASQTEDPATPNDALNILTQAVEAVTTVAAGKCSMDTSTYTGTGTGGASGPTTLIFPKRPALIAVMGEDFLMLLNDQISEGRAPTIITNNGARWGRVEISWQGNTLRYYDTDGYPGRQGNNKNVVYQVSAFYAQG